MVIGYISVKQVNKVFNVFLSRKYGIYFCHVYSREYGQESEKGGISCLDESFSVKR